MPTSEFAVRTSERLQVIDVTPEVGEAVSASGVQDGIAVVSVPHTTCAVVVNEGDPDLWEDILKSLTGLVPVGGRYRHNEKYAGMPGEQNAHAHIISSMVGNSRSIPVREGRLDLGTWQRVLLLELDGPRTRTVRVSVLGL